MFDSSENPRCISNWPVVACPPNGEVEGEDGGSAEGDEFLFSFIPGAIGDGVLETLIPWAIGDGVLETLIPWAIGDGVLDALIPPIAQVMESLSFSRPSDLYFWP